MDAMVERIARAETAMAEGRSIQLVVEDKADAAIMAWVAVTRLNQDSSRGELGCWLGDAYHGHRYATEAAYLA